MCSLRACAGRSMISKEEVGGKQLRILAQGTDKCYHQNQVINI